MTLDSGIFTKQLLEGLKDLKAKGRNREEQEKRLKSAKERNDLITVVTI